MSVSGISSSSLITSSNQTPHNNLRKFQHEFQQLGSDLQTGTLAAARQDFATLRQLAGQGNSTSPAASSSPILQTFHRLGQDLESGSVSAAQQDYIRLQTDFQKVEHAHNHLRHPVRGFLEISQGNDQSGQALPSRNVSSAPAAYNSALQDFQHFGQSTAASLTPELSPLSANSVSVSA